MNGIKETHGNVTSEGGQGGRLKIATYKDKKGMKESISIYHCNMQTREKLGSHYNLFNKGNMVVPKLNWSEWHCL